MGDAGVEDQTMLILPVLIHHINLRVAIPGRDKDNLAAIRRPGSKSSAGSLVSRCSCRLEVVPAEGERLADSLAADKNVVFIGQ